MATTYVLIDFENVQPRNLEILVNHPFKVLVFVGAAQAKIPFDLAAAMQQLGDRARYIKISGNGKNALDFHLAFYLGELVTREPDAAFHLISRDSGFDPLIRHLRERKIRVQREKDLAEIPLLRMPGGSSTEEKIAAIVKNLAGRGQSRPRKVNTLTNTIKTLFTNKLDERELTELVSELERRRFIVVHNSNVSYQFSPKP